MPDTPRVSNAEIKRTIEDTIAPIVEDNKKRIDWMEPLVKSHQVVLFGKPDDIEDQGLVGMLLDVRKLIKGVSSWVKPLALGVLSFVILTVIQKLLDVILIVQTLPK